MMTGRNVRILVVLVKMCSTNHLGVTHAKIDLLYRSQPALVTLSIVIFFLCSELFCEKEVGRVVFQHGHKMPYISYLYSYSVRFGVNRCVKAKYM